MLELLRQNDLTAGEIASHFPISKPSVSHHLGTLKRAGLVTDTRQGQNIVYSLETTVFQEALAWLLGLANHNSTPPHSDISSEKEAKVDEKQ